MTVSLGLPRGPSQPMYDDGYVDPPSVNEILQEDNVGRGLVRRIKALEAALLPLAARATVMKSIHMNYAAAGAKLDHAGGTWVMSDGGPLAMFTESEHRAALDVVGRERTRLFMAEQVERAQEQRNAAEEAQKYTESGKDKH